MKKSELIHLIKEIITEMPFGPQGYFPSIGADLNDKMKDDIEQIYKNNTAIKVAKALKKVIDAGNEKLNPRMMIAPFVNYYSNTKEGNLILGVCFTNIPPYNGDDWKITEEAEKEYKELIKKALSLGNTELWYKFHMGISGKYNGVKWKTGIVYSIVTPGRKFAELVERQLKQILGL